MNVPPLLALSIGDPAGIGPEITLRLLREPPQVARLLLIGDAGTLESAAGLVEDRRLLPIVEQPEDVAPVPGTIALWAGATVPAHACPPGVVDAAAGAACHAWVREAAAFALSGRVDGMVTGPIHKASWHAAGISSPGHTEALRDQAGVERVLMMLVGGRLRTALATIHVPLRAVADLLDPISIREDLILLGREMGHCFGLNRPRIAVCGLNPHAGEDGIFGSEDIEIIAPAVAAARAAGVDAYGPLPADACIPAAAEGRYDAVLAMYHDQALPAVKSLAPRSAVNVTLGLPFVRTSVDHGTAFDIAGRGIARATSLRAAISLGAEMATRFRKHPVSGAAGDSTPPVPPPT
jgi:4-hydroxythreonine-4-phosphate dehydrogenase